MKKFVFFFALLLVLSVAGIMRFDVFPGRKPLYIAVVGPLSKPNGRAMLQGAQLYLNSLKQTGGLTGRNIKLLPFDDNNDPRLAVNIAETIAADNRSLLVLGHYGSAASLAAGDIYRDSGIPAITASATDSAITYRNDWYFGLVPDTAFQAVFLANYLKNALNRDSASLIVDTDSYGLSLAEGFTSAAPQLGIEIRRRWDFDAESDRLERALSRISTELRTEPDPGVIVFATHAVEAARILTSIQLPGTNYTVIGPDALAGDAFPEALDQYPLERQRPGYYSDGIYAATPFLMTLGETQAQQWRQTFLQTYNTEPSWVSAGYYDAAHVVVKAVQRAEIKSNDDIWNRRKKIKQALSGINHPDTALPGLTGPLYFTQQRRVEHPFMIGRYQQQHLLPAFTQYGLRRPGAHQSDERAIHVAGHALTPFQVVHTGIDVNRIPRFNSRAGRYTLDFYLWFRFGQAFDDARIAFANANSPLSLGSPVMVDEHDGSTTHVYRVQGDFSNPGEFRAYPFDRQALRISFQHAAQSAETVRYTPDVVGLNPLWRATQRPQASPLNLPGWRIDDVVSYQQTVRHSPADSSGAEQQFSRFHTDILVARQGAGMLVKPFAPLLMAFLLLALVYLLPAGYSGAQTVCVAGALLTTALNQRDIPAVTAISRDLLLNAVFFAVYGLTLLSLLYIVVLWRLRKHGDTDAFTVGIRVSRILFPVLTVCIAGWLTYQYDAAHAISGRQMPADLPLKVHETGSPETPAQLAELRVSAYYDANENSTPDGGAEIGIEGIRFKLDTGHSTVTDADGEAHFLSLSPCAYTITLAEESLPETYQLAERANKTVELQPQGRHSVVFALISRDVPPTPTPTPVPTPTPTPDITPTPMPTPMPTPTPSIDMSMCVYVVKPGDSVRLIAWKFTGDTGNFRQIMRVNHLDSPKLWPEIRLSLPKRLLLPIYQPCSGELIAPAQD